MFGARPRTPPSLSGVRPVPFLLSHGETHTGGLRTATFINGSSARRRARVCVHTPAVHSIGRARVNDRKVYLYTEKTRGGKIHRR